MSPTKAVAGDNGNITSTIKKHPQYFMQDCHHHCLKIAQHHNISNINCTFNTNNNINNNNNATTANDITNNKSIIKISTSSSTLNKIISPVVINDLLQDIGYLPNYA